ncbi:MAG: electron transport complex subunit E [Acidobacteria bacterium]|nr:MAG: electron transport complex subunit E [Acidobacteriota bacterium]
MKDRERAARAAQEFVKGLWRENPVFVAVLGLCPSLAVTNSLKNGLVMGAATTFVLVGSSLLVSLARHLIPRQVRISVYIVIIATFVTCVDFVLAALMPDAHKQLGAFISLIVVNCLILGRQEAFASKNPVWLAVPDALGMAGGFTLALSMIGAIRELLGKGSLLGYPVLGSRFEPWAIMILPPGGFFALGALLTVFAAVRTAAERRRQRKAFEPPAAERRTA